MSDRNPRRHQGIDSPNAPHRRRVGRGLPLPSSLFRADRDPESRGARLRRCGVARPMPRATRAARSAGCFPEVLVLRLAHRLTWLEISGTLGRPALRSAPPSPPSRAHDSEGLPGRPAPHPDPKACEQSYVASHHGRTAYAAGAESAKSPRGASPGAVDAPTTGPGALSRADRRRDRRRLRTPNARTIAERLGACSPTIFARLIDACRRGEVGYVQCQLALQRGWERGRRDTRTAPGG